MNDLFSSSFYLEDKRFKILVGGDVIRNICWRIAGCGWFLWRELYMAMHQLPQKYRAQAWRFIRISQKERKRYERSDTSLAWWRDKHTHRHDFTAPRFFEMPINPFAYQVGCFPIYLGKGKIGTTLNFDRVKGGMVRVYYKSDLKVPLEVQRIEKVFRDREFWEGYMKVEPLVSPAYHMKIRKNVAA